MPSTDDVVRRVQSRLGTTLGGKWKLERVLGIGGMAAVYSAVHRNQHRVAIKMLHPEQSLSTEMRTRFLREGYVGNTVDHRSVVRVQDDGVTDDGAAFLVMELLEGETLEARRERHGGRLPIAEVLAVADLVLGALIAAHEKGVVHRDIKPDNLFLTYRGELKILDFGIARLQEQSDSGSGTRAGTFMGTPSFMPPEQARGRWDEVDGRSDLWAVGATMFTLASGRLVHEAETVTEQLARAVRDPAPPIVSVTPDIPESAAQVIDKAIAFAKAQRFEDAEGMRRAVRAVLREVGPPRTLSVPVPGGLLESIAAPFDDTQQRKRLADTLAATPTKVSSSGSELSSVSGASVSTASSPLRRSAIVVAAGLGLLAIVIGIVVISRGSSEPELGAAQVGQRDGFGPLTPTDEKRDPKELPAAERVEPEGPPLAPAASAAPTASAPAPAPTESGKKNLPPSAPKAGRPPRAAAEKVRVPSKPKSAPKQPPPADATKPGTNTILDRRF